MVSNCSTARIIAKFGRTFCGSKFLLFELRKCANKSFFFFMCVKLTLIFAELFDKSVTSPFVLNLMNNYNDNETINLILKFSVYILSICSSLVA